MPRLRPDTRRDRDVAAGVPGRSETSVGRAAHATGCLGLRMYRVGWTVNDVRYFIVDTLRFGGGTWVSGIYGAVAEFCVGEGEPIDLDIGEAVVNASTSRGAISFRLSEHVRALAFGSSPDPAGADIVVAGLGEGRRAGILNWLGLLAVAVCRLGFALMRRTVNRIESK
jgi:hypothetical protein